MTASVTDAAALAEGVPAAEGWRFVQAAAPGLVKALDEARAAYDENETALQERAAAGRGKTSRTKMISKPICSGSASGTRRLPT